MDKLKFHPIADCFPLLKGNEFELLVEDIKANGLRHSIWLHPDGSIIDGRNRYLACLEAGVEPRFKIWDGDGSPIDFVISENVRRRDLNSGQRACVASNLVPFFEAEAEARQKAPLKRGKSVAAKLQQREKGRAVELAAKVAHASARYTYEAKKLKEQLPEVFAHVQDGSMTLQQAKAAIARGISTLLIDQEFHAVIPPMTPEEFGRLERSIVKHGCIQPIDVWRGIILDGHARYAICLRRGIPFETTDQTERLPDREAALQFIVSVQLNRKNLTPAEIQAVLAHFDEFDEYGDPTEAACARLDDQMAVLTLAENTRRGEVQ